MKNPDQPTPPQAEQTPPLEQKRSKETISNILNEFFEHFLNPKMFESTKYPSTERFFKERLKNILQESNLENLQLGFELRSILFDHLRFKLRELQKIEEESRSGDAFRGGDVEKTLHLLASLKNLAS